MEAMNTTKSAPAPKSAVKLTENESRVLTLIRTNDGACEGTILNLLFPAPKWPKGAAVGSPEAAVWYDAHLEYNAKAFGGVFHRRDGSLTDETPYGLTYSHQRYEVTKRLTDLGLIREHNNGFNSYHWTAAS